MQEQKRAQRSQTSTELPPDDLVDALELLKEITRQFWGCFPYKPDVCLHVKVIVFLILAFLVGRKTQQNDE